MTTDNYYSDEMNARRDKFNRIINGINMILMNNIPEVDPSVYENWQGRDPMGNDECDIIEESGKAFCNTHGIKTDDDYECEDHEEESEIYQWYAVGDSDAEYLKNHNQYITYSNLLDTYFLAITHFGTSWDYVDSMVNDILGDK